jgi:methionyl-tRNA formyltransferase
MNTCYAAKLSKAEAEVKWSAPARDIERAVRAYNAWPVAYSCYQKNGKAVKLRIWQAEVIEKSAGSTAPGTVIAESAKGIDVATGDGVLRITQLQPEGKRCMTTADFLNANTLQQQILG